MEKIATYVFILSLAAVFAIPLDDLIIKKLNDGPQYQYMTDDEGNLHLVNTWMKASDLAEASRYNPDTQNIYHLFTRQNPVVSQPMLLGNSNLLGLTNYNPLRRTIIIIHGWMSTVTGDVNTVLVPAFLSAEDVNVIVVDWSAGAGTVLYWNAVTNTVTSGKSVAAFINWLNEATGATPTHYHLVGHSLGAHMAGIIGRNTNGKIAYITGLDAAFPGWITHDDCFRSDDAAYTEIIHTNAGLLGYIATLGHVDFYPNGGINMPGCDTQDCDHSRSYYYMAESLLSGGFTGTRCATYAGAMAGNCFFLGRLHMGGLVPKTGASGIYYLETNADQPFSRG